LALFFNRAQSDLGVWISEIRLRAVIRIGALSRELEKAERTRTDLHDNDVGQTKTGTREQAGINIRTAECYEEQTSQAGGEKPFGTSNYTSPRQTAQI
jgi:hypothetical protein